MNRNRNRKTPVWVMAPLWAGAALVVGWGLWQMVEIRRTVLADVRQREVFSGETVTSRPSAAVEGVMVTAEERAVGNGVGVDSLRVGPREGAGTIDVIDPLQVVAETLKVLPTERGAGVREMPALDPGLTAEALMAQGAKLMNAGQVVEGRWLLNAALARATEEEMRGRLRGVLSQLNASVFMGTALLPDDPAARYIEIRSGDSFLKLGRAFGVPAAFLEEINPGLNARNLKPLTGVKVVQGPFALTLVKHAGRVDLYAREMYVRSFAMELPEGNLLPVGGYRVETGAKIQVGKRQWIGFEGTEAATEGVGSGWLFGSAGPRGKESKDRMTGVRLSDVDLQQVYRVLVESRSVIRVEP